MQRFPIPTKPATQSDYIPAAAFYDPADAALEHARTTREIVARIRAQMSSVQTG